MISEGTSQQIPLWLLDADMEANLDQVISTSEGSQPAAKEQPMLSHSRQLVGVEERPGESREMFLDSACEHAAANTDGLADLIIGSEQCQYVDFGDSLTGPTQENCDFGEYTHYGKNPSIKSDSWYLPECYLLQAII